MLRLVQKGLMDYGVCYSNNICPYISEEQVIIKSDPIPNLKLGLIRRKGHIVEMDQWCHEKKGVIVSEYPS